MRPYNEKACRGCEVYYALLLSLPWCRSLSCLFKPSTVWVWGWRPALAVTNLEKSSSLSWTGVFVTFRTVFGVGAFHCKEGSRQWALLRQSLFLLWPLCKLIRKCPITACTAGLLATVLLHIDNRASRI